jgi:cytochrome P450
MFGYALLAAVAFVAYQSVKYMIAWRRNVALAKASGIPYVVVPLYVYSLFMLLFNRPATNLMRKLLPSAWTRPWLDLVVPLHSWHTLYAAFKDIGSDTYLTVAPGGIMLWTCDADVIAQMTTRRGDFPKPTEFYTNIDIFGKNVVSSEGQYWRHHRKIVAPPFAEKNNNLVWEESIHQGLEMMKKWAGADGNEAKAVRTAPEDTMRVSLHIISRAGFGQRLTWPGSDENELVRTQSGKEATMNKWPGHELSYFDALSGLLENLVWVVAGGKLLGKNSNFDKAIREQSLTPVRQASL